MREKRFYEKTFVFLMREREKKKKDFQPFCKKGWRKTFRRFAVKGRELQTVWKNSKNRY